MNSGLKDEPKDKIDDVSLRVYGWVLISDPA